MENTREVRESDIKSELLIEMDDSDVDLDDSLLDDATAPKSTDDALKKTLKPSNKGNVVAVARRNERERNRVKHINRTFAILRQHIPTRKPSKKLSKVDTLKCATAYISSLQQLIRDHDGFMAIQQNIRAQQQLYQSSVYTSHTSTNLLQNQHRQHHQQSQLSFHPSVFTQNENDVSRKQQLRMPLHVAMSPSSPSASVMSAASPGYSSDSSWEGFQADSEESQSMIPRLSPEVIWP